MNIPEGKGLSENLYYTVREAVAFLGVKEQTIRNYLKNNDLEGDKVGPKNMWVIPGHEIIRLRKEWKYNKIKL